MGIFLVSATLESKIMIVECFIRVTIGAACLIKF